MPSAAMHRRIAHDLSEQIALRVAAADVHNVMTLGPEQVGGFVAVARLISDHTFA